MICRDVLERLSPFLDDELDPLASREILEHLESCPGCTVALARHRELSLGLRSDLDYHRASDLLGARVLRAVRGTTAGTAVRRDEPAARSWLWRSLVAALLLLVGGSWWFALSGRVDRDTLIAREAVSAHIRSLMASHLTDVASSDHHTVKPWFGGRLDYSPPVADFGAEGFLLVGGRLDYLQNRTVAALVYRYRAHLVNVFVWPVADAREAFEPPLVEQGFQVIRGTHAQMAYCLVSDLNATELKGFARRLAARPHAP